MATHKIQGRFCFTFVLNQGEDARDLANYEEPIVVEVTIWTATISNLNSLPQDNGEEVNGSDACEVRIEMKKFLKINKDWGHHTLYRFIWRRSPSRLRWWKKRTWTRGFPPSSWPTLTSLTNSWWEEDKQQEAFLENDFSSNSISYIRPPSSLLTSIRERTRRKRLGWAVSFFYSHSNIFLFQM